jgi:hypothetical protein
VRLIQDEGAVKEFGPASADPAFHDRVGPRRQLHRMKTIGTDACG